MINIPFRIKVGITGHRDDLPELEILKTRIRQVLGYNDWGKNKTVSDNSIFSLFGQEDISQLKKTKNTPIAFNILTSLAKGADRITADVVLEIESSMIEVVMPLQKEDYLEGQDNDSKNDFEKLYKRDHHPVVLHEQKLGTHLSGDEKHSIKNEAYLVAGKYVVDHCDVLLAIWNGEPAKGIGGTANIISYAQQNKKPVIIISSNDPTKIIVHKFNGLNTQALKQIEFFNSYPVELELIDAYVDNVYKDFFENGKILESKSIYKSIAGFLKEYLFPYYAKASVISKLYKKRYNYSGIGTYMLSSLAVIIVVIAVIFKLFDHFAFIIEFILLSVVLITIRTADKKHVHKKWLENRSMTEHIRLMPYFFITGRSISKLRVASLNETNKDDTQWLIRILNEIWDQLNSKWCSKNNHEDFFQPDSKDLIRYLKKSWVTSQVAYHENFCKKNKPKNERLEKGGQWLFAIAMAAALAHIITGWLHEHENILLENIFTSVALIFPLLAAVFDENVLLGNILTSVALILPPLAAVLEGVRRHREYSRNIRRSDSMRRRLKELELRYDNASDHEDITTLLRDTEQLMLEETEDWMMLMVDSKLEYPA